MTTERHDDVGAETMRAIDAFMARLAAIPAMPHLPAADMLWIKAQLLRRWDAEHKLTLPADILEPVQVAALLAAAAVLVFEVLPAVLHTWLPQ
jgi:hypothetical protein